MTLAIASRSRLGRSGAPLLALLAACLCLLICPWAAAQGTSGQLPDPITSQELARWLNRHVAPTPAQWEAIDALHEQYKKEFTDLREGEIEKFLQQSRQMQGQMPDRAQMKAFVDSWQRLNQRIRQIDGRFFDAIQGTLAEGQMARFQRVRTARERTSGRGSMASQVMGGMPVDLAEIVENLDLDREVFMSLDPVLVPYEQQIARRLQDLNEAGMGMMSDLVTKLNDLGFGDVNNEEIMKDPERMKALMEAMQEAFRETGRKSREKAAEIAKLNHANRRRIAALLPEEKALAFRREFVQRAYPGVGSEAETERLLSASIRLRGLDESQRAALEQLRATWRADDEKLENEQMAFQDKIALERSPFDFMGSDMEEQQREVADQREKRRRVATSAVEQAKAIVGPERAEHLDKLARGGAESPEHFATGAEASGVATDPAPNDPLEHMGRRGSSGEDQFLQAQLSPADIADWSRRLGLDDARRAILETLHVDYLQRWEDTVSPAIRSLHEAQTRAWRTDGGGGAPQITVADITATYAAREAARAAIRGVEERFFEDIKHVVVEPSQTPVVDALALGRTTAITGMGTFGMFDDSRESSVDLVGVIADALGDDRFEEVAVAVLLEGGPALKQASEEVVRTMLDGQREMEIFGARMQESGREGVFDSMAEVQERWTEMSRKSKAASDKRRAAVRELLDKVCAGLTPAEAAGVRRAYNREAFPRIFQDRLSAAPILERAQGLAELTDHQRQELAKMAIEFEDAYERLNERLMEVARSSPGMPAGMDPQAWQEWQDRRNQMDRIRFERTELSSRTVRRVATILGEELSAKVPAIANHAKEAAKPTNPFE